MLKEFKEFAFGGTLVESAVAFVMALAAAALITSLVENVITPIIAAIFGQPDFSSLSIDIGEAAITYGAFLNALITFTSVAAAVFFFIVRPYNAYKAKRASGQVAEEAPPAEDIALLRQIRDSLARG
jgi:large conductance mechanosensitive channel